MDKRFADDPEIARHARQRLDDAWYQWLAFGDPPAIVKIRYRIKDGEEWMQEHDETDAQYASARKLLSGLRYKLTEAMKDEHEVQRETTWLRLEADFLAAEADYLSIVGRPQYE